MSSIGSPSKSPILCFDPGSSGHLRRLDDIGNPVVQINFDGDLIALGDRLSIQEAGISHRQCPGLSFFCFKRDRPLVLFDGHDSASAEDGRRITGRDSRTDREEKAESKNESHAYVHHCTS